jgi:hypothetical protein
MEWDEDALKQLEMVPEQWREKARETVEKIAAERSKDRVSADEVAIAKARFLSGSL